MSARRIVNRVLLTLWRACVEFVDDRGHRDAAQIAFFAVLSFVPLAMLLVGGFGLFFDDEEIRRRVVTAVFENVPLSQGSDRARLESTVDGAIELYFEYLADFGVTTTKRFAQVFARAADTEVESTAPLVRQPPLSRMRSYVRRARPPQNPGLRPRRPPDGAVGR